MKKILCVVFSLLIFMLSLSGCGKSLDNVTDEMFALDTIIRFTVYGSDKELCKNTIDDCKAEIVRLENLLSAKKESSDIYKLNQADGKAVEVSDETLTLIKNACEISEATDGAFDISIRPLMSVWGFDTKEYKVPTDEEITKALSNVGYENIITNGNEVTIKDGMAVDLGAIAKGYIGDKVRGILNESSVYSAIVDMGGMIITKGDGKSEDDLFWNIGLQYPDDKGDCFFTFDCSFDAISTSGAYQRYFESGKVKYHHIIDRKTGKPSNSDISSVTVIGDLGFESDALSTAFFVMGIDKTIDYVNTHKNATGDRYQLIIMSSDMKTLYLSEEFKTRNLNYEILAPYNKGIEIVYI